MVNLILQAEKIYLQFLLFLSLWLIIFFVFLHKLIFANLTRDLDFTSIG
jgi:hypothetical protein